MLFICSFVTSYHRYRLFKLWMKSRTDNTMAKRKRTKGKTTL